MPNIDLSFAQDPNTLALAMICGMIPAVIWLFFWLRENRSETRRGDILAYAFLGGILMVIPTLPIESFIATLTNDTNTLTILWAATEELLKFGIFAAIILHGARRARKPVDYAVYIMVVALGFAGFENALYFLQPLQAGDSVVLLLSGSMRFLGTTLMHATAAGFVGLGLGLAYFKNKKIKMLAAAAGLVSGIALHSVFNIYIVQNSGEDFLQVFAILWCIVIASLILFEYVRKMGSDAFLAKRKIKIVTGLTETFHAMAAKYAVVVTDEGSFQALAATKGVTTAQAEVQAFITRLRAEYVEYLTVLESDEATRLATAGKVVPDTISPRAIGGILTVLAH